MDDAYPHLPIHPRELEVCLIWSESQEPFADLLLWRSFFFGLRSAPLVWCKFVAALMRILQSVYDHHRVRGQVYIDDILWMLRGTWRRRCAMLSLF